MNTFDSICSDLKNIGICKGDTVFLRISYKSLGPTEGGPKTFIDSVVNILGPEGTVLLTAFPQVYKSQLRCLHRKDAVGINIRPKAVTGALSNVAMDYPNAYMSHRMDFPFVVIGEHAEYLTQNHGYDKGGYWILEEAIEKYDCKCLRIGGEPFIGTTHMSLSHILREKGEYQKMPRYGLYVRDENGLTWRENNNVVFCPNALKQYLPKLHDKIIIKEGKIGQGYAILTDMKKSLLAEEDILREDVRDILCSDPDCCLCQTTFSFSPKSKTEFLFHQFKRLLQGKITIKKIMYFLKTYMVFTRNNN